MRKDKLRNAILKVLMEDLEDTATWNGGGGIPSNGNNSSLQSTQNYNSNYNSSSNQLIPYMRSDYSDFPPYPTLPPDFPAPTPGNLPYEGAMGYYVEKDEYGKWVLVYRPYGGSGRTLMIYDLIWNPFTKKYTWGWKDWQQRT